MAYFKIITGPMFSGKTEELIRILHRGQIAGKRIAVVKPALDTRSNSTIISRKKENPDSNFKKFTEFPAIPIADAAEFRDLLQKFNPEILALDETQFFDEWIFDFIRNLLIEKGQSDLLVLAAGLDMDAWGQPFGSMPKLLAIADEVQKETAICFKCKQPATITQKLSDTGKTVEVGDAELYEARCRACHTLPEQTLPLDKQI